MSTHVHTELDEYGYCRTCSKRVMTHFRGFPLADRLCRVCDHGLSLHRDRQVGYWCNVCNEPDESAGPCF